MTKLPPFFPLLHHLPYLLPPTLFSGVIPARPVTFLSTVPGLLVHW